MKRVIIYFGLFILLQTMTMRSWARDSDGDGFVDVIDTCPYVASACQNDTDNDGIGNFCDPDFNNDDVVNFGDLSLFYSKFLSDDLLYDLNCDGYVNFVDFGMLKSMFLEAPGPGTLPVANIVLSPNDGYLNEGEDLTIQFIPNTDSELMYVSTDWNSATLECFYGGIGGPQTCTIDSSSIDESNVLKIFAQDLSAGGVAMHVHIPVYKMDERVNETGPITIVSWQQPDTIVPYSPVTVEGTYSGGYLIHWLYKDDTLLSVQAGDKFRYHIEGFASLSRGQYNVISYNHLGDEYSKTFTLDWPQSTLPEILNFQVIEETDEDEIFAYENPESITIEYGSRLEMEILAFGDGDLTYEFSANGEVLSSGPSNKYTDINYLYYEDLLFEVKVSNSNGSVTKSVEVLRGWSPSLDLLVNGQPGSYTGIYMDMITLEAVSDNPDSDTYSWTKNGEPFAGNSPFQTFFLTEDTVGLYCGTAENRFGDRRVCIELALGIPPIIDKLSINGQSGTVELPYENGSDWIKIYLVDNGSANPRTYSWYKDGIPLNESGSWYNIRRDDVASSGIYEARVSNIYGADSKTIEIQIVEPMPEIDGPVITSHTEYAGNYFTIHSRITGTNLTYRWYLNGTRIEHASDPSRTIFLADNEQIGTYSVVAENSAGYAKTITELNVLAEPEENPFIHENSIALTVTDSSDTGKYVFNTIDVIYRQQTKLRYLTENASNYKVGDFNGDGTDDILHPRNDGWYISQRGRLPFKKINSYSSANIQVGDFNGDGHQDIFNANGSKWRISYGGTSSWQTLKNTSISDQLHLGDFDGDGITDVLYPNGSYMYWSRSGTEAGTLANGFLSTDSFKVADTNGNGRSEVIALAGDDWLVYDLTTGDSILRVNEADLPMSKVIFADITGDGVDNIITNGNGHWYFKELLPLKWNKLWPLNKGLNDIIVGDFDASGAKEIGFTIGQKVRDQYTNRLVVHACNSCSNALMREAALSYARNTINQNGLNHKDYVTVKITNNNINGAYIYVARKKNQTKLEYSATMMYSNIDLSQIPDGLDFNKGTELLTEPEEPPIDDGPGPPDCPPGSEHCSDIQ